MTDFEAYAELCGAVIRLLEDRGAAAQFISPGVILVWPRDGTVDASSGARVVAGNGDPPRWGVDLYVGDAFIGSLSSGPILDASSAEVACASAHAEDVYAFIRDALRRAQDALRRSEDIAQGDPS